MMRVLIVVSVVAVAGLFYWAFAPAVNPPEAGVARAPEQGSSGIERSVEKNTNRPTEADDEAARAQGLEPGQQEEPPPAPAEADPAAKLDEGDPLKGLGMAPATLDELKKAGAPDRFEGGILVTQVHPDSPAAEVALEAGDIIVRAQTTDVESVNALQDFVRGREYTRITIVRDGVMSQVILKPPFVPDAERRN